MKINIQKNVTVDAIKQQFTSAFPFLKLEIFKRKSTPGHLSVDHIVAPGDALIQDVQPLLCTGVLNIYANTKVSELEHELASRFLLIAQIFRRSKNVWLETTATDNWTLQQQNDHGRKMSECSPDTEEPEDYELQRGAD